MLGNIGPLEIAIVLIVALLVFGPKRLPELGNSLGRSIREFRGTLSGEKQDEPQVGPPSAEAQPGEKQPAAESRD
jgi:sec-independent protein translocase protein TatA